jgi:hypothetical protein
MPRPLPYRFHAGRGLRVRDAARLEQFDWRRRPRKIFDDAVGLAGLVMDARGRNYITAIASGVELWAKDARRALALDSSGLGEPTLVSAGPRADGESFRQIQGLFRALAFRPVNINDKKMIYIAGGNSDLRVWPL